jgi:hypothetical protein
MKNHTTRREPTRVSRGLFTDLVTLLRRSSSGGGFDALTTASAWEPFRVLGFMKPANSLPNTLRLGAQTTSDPITYTLYLQQYPKDFDNTWRVEWGSRLYRAVSVQYLRDGSRLLVIALSELGSSEFASSFD